MAEYIKLDDKGKEISDEAEIQRVKRLVYFLRMLIILFGIDLLILTYIAIKLMIKAGGLN